jgi:2-methylcitrate dehydratase PrpD
MGCGLHVMNIAWTGENSIHITRRLARWIINLKYRDLPLPVVHEAKRSLLNWAGVTIGGSRHSSIDVLVSLAKELGRKKCASVFGRKEKVDLWFGALINGTSSNIFDFDDTYLETLLHTGPPVAPVAFALGESLNLNGRDLLTAYIAAVEADCRLSRSMFPDHYEAGWHITSTIGNIGAAIAAGKLLNLGEDKMVYAIGIAATQAAGLREMFGTMTKAYHCGKAAMNGIMAAQLAQGGMTSSPFGIEGKTGFAKVLSTKQDYSRLFEGIGKKWELLSVSYKPFACGIVCHPVMDGILKLREEYHLRVDEVDRVELWVNRLVPILAGKKDPQNGIEAKLSAYYCAAVALIDGGGGEEQFMDHKVHDKKVAVLRGKIRIKAMPEISADEAIIKIRKKNGEILKKHIVHVTGSRKNPMTDRMLHEKFWSLVKPLMKEKQIEEAQRMLLNLEKVSSIQEVTQLCRA